MTPRLSPPPLPQPGQMRVLFSVNDTAATLFVNNTKVFEAPRQAIESVCGEAVGKGGESWWPKNCLSLVPANGVSLVNQDNLWHTKHAPESPRSDSSISVIQNVLSRLGKMRGSLPRETAYPTQSDRMIVEDLQAYGKTAPYNIARFDVFRGKLNASDVQAMHECGALEWTKLEQIPDAVRPEAALNAEALALSYVSVAVLLVIFIAWVLFVVCVPLRELVCGTGTLSRNEPVNAPESSSRRTVRKVEQEFRDGISVWTMGFVDGTMEEMYRKYVFKRDWKLVQLSYMLLFIPYILLINGYLVLVGLVCAVIIMMVQRYS